MRSPAAFAASAAEAERLGFRYGFIPSSPLLVADPYVMIAAALQATTRLTVGPLIENPVVRHPAVIAGSIATVDGLAPGRTLLGLGAGDTAVRLLGRRPATVAQLGAATRLIVGLLDGAGIDVGAAAPARLRHARRVPVWIAAQGPKTLRMAGAIADGVFLRVGTSAANIGAAIAAVRSGAREAGRDPAAVGFALVLRTVLGDEPARVAAVARAMAAGYYEYSPGLFDVAGVAWNGPDIDELKRDVWPDFHHAADLQRAGDIVGFLGPDACDAFCLHGDADAVRAQLRQVIACGGALGVTFAPIVLHPVPLYAPGEGPAPGPHGDALQQFGTQIVQHFI